MTRSVAFGDAPVRYALSPLWGDADAQVEQTIAVMCRYAVEDSSSPLIQEDAQAALALGGGDPLLGVWKLCKERFRFQQDATTAEGTSLPRETKDSIIEVVIRPVDLSLMWRRALQPVEDCDGYSTYAASLLYALKVPCFFCAVAVDPLDPNQYSHVYVVAYTDDGGRLAIDASHGKYCGWEVPNPYNKRKEWKVEYSPVVMWIVMAAAVGTLAWAWMKGNN